MLALLSSSESWAANKDPQEDVFAVRLEKLRRTPSVDGGKAQRDQVVSRYKALIDEYPTHPRVAEAMLDIAVRLRIVNPELNIFPKGAEALDWIRKAAGTATPGSKVWYEAQFWLASEPHHSSTAECRRILQRITEQAKGHSLTLARVEDNLMTIALTERDLDQAERHCRRILDWYKDPKRIPADQEEKYELDGLMRGTSGIVYAFLTAPWPRTEREKRIRALMHDYWIPALQRDGDEALKRLATPLYDDEHVPVPSAEQFAAAKAREAAQAKAAEQVRQEPPARAVDRPSRWWLAFAGGGLVVLGGVFAWLRKRARRAAH